MRRGAISLAVALLVAAAAACATVGTTPPGRGVLWDVVEHCLDPAAPDYCARCRVPLAGTCGPARGCEATTEVWAQTPEYVAIRDLKMCGCPAGFVHGLAIPRTPVTGVEDPRRPRGIWRFAWDAARARVAEADEIGLAANPAERRSQDQLHVHLVRLQPDARARLAGQSPVRVEELEGIWDAATGHAGAPGLGGRGVLVVRDPAGGFLVITEATSIERTYTVGRCR